MNCLFTVNINSFLHAKSRKTYIDAATRWACDYHEITGGTLGYTNPFVQKYYGFVKLSNYSEVCYIDGDCIISENCPSPFQFDINASQSLLNFSSSIGNVIRVVQDAVTTEWKIASYETPITSLNLKLKNLGENKFCWNGKPEDFFNNGFFVCSPKSEIFNLMVNAIQSRTIESPQDEQALFNLLVFSKQWLVPVYLDRVWNWLEVPLGPNPNAWIRHFAGCLVAEKHRLINEAIP
jgi:hypothetical protein